MYIIQENEFSFVQKEEKFERRGEKNQDKNFTQSKRKTKNPDLPKLGTELKIMYDENSQFSSFIRFSAIHPFLDL